MSAERNEPNTQRGFTDYLGVKKITPLLIKRLRSSSRLCHAPIGLRMLLLASKITDGLEGRNLVAHGAFYIDEDTDSIGVAHFFQRGEGKNREWFEANQPITENIAREAIREIDQLLREAVSIRTALHVWHSHKDITFPSPVN